MADPDDLRARIEALESSLAHLDRVIEDLNGALTAQWSEIDRLGRRLAETQDRVSDAEDRAGASTPVQNRPITEER